MRSSDTVSQERHGEREKFKGGCLYRIVPAESTVVGALPSLIHPRFSDYKSEISPARNLLQGNWNFLCKLPKFGNETKAELIAVICHNKQSAQLGLQNKEYVLSQLDTTPLSQLLDYVDSEVRKMEGADANWSRKRRDKKATRFQDFAVTFNRFLKAYSGIVNIVGGTDFRFSHLAFATLSLLFVVSTGEMQIVQLETAYRNIDREDEG